MKSKTYIYKGDTKNSSLYTLPGKAVIPFSFLKNSYFETHIVTEDEGSVTEDKEGEEVLP